MTDQLTRPLTDQQQFLTRNNDLTMARGQQTRRQTRKGSERMADDERQAKIAEFTNAHEKMTDEERQAEIDSVRKELGILPRKPPGVDEGPYEADTTEETDMTEQASAPTPKDTINIDSGDDNDNDDEDEEDDNTLHPRTARKQGCENRTEEPLFSNDSDNDHGDNDHNDHYSESSDDESNKKNKSRRTPKSTIRTPKKTYWSGNGLPAAQEAATVLVAIGANPNVAKFMVDDGLDEIAEIQQLTRETISLYAKNSRKNLSGSDIVSTRFILDLEKAAFKMTHIQNRISRVIDPSDIVKKSCR